MSKSKPFAVPDKRDPAAVIADIRMRSSILQEVTEIESWPVLHELRTCRQGDSDFKQTTPLRGGYTLLPPNAPVDVVAKTKFIQDIRAARLEYLNTLRAAIGLDPKESL